MHDLLAAFCLVLVFEGILPFVNPNGWREALRRLSELEDRTLRIAGAASMVTGLILLNLVRG